MKKLHLPAIALLCMMIVFQSCSKQSTGQMVAPVSPNIINAKIAPNQLYTFTVNKSGNVNIEKQASHYKISKTCPDEKSRQMIYQYLPAQDYTGIDEVVLSSKSTIISFGNSGGCNSSSSYTNVSGTTSYTTSYTTIRLTINN